MEDNTVDIAVQIVQEDEPFNEYMKDFMALTDVDEALASELFQEFRSYFPASCKKLQEAMEHNDTASLNMLAHQLKGASGNLRIDSVYTLSMELEAAAKNNDLAGSSSLITKIIKLSKDETVDQEADTSS